MPNKRLWFHSHYFEISNVGQNHNNAPVHPWYSHHTRVWLGNILVCVVGVYPRRNLPRSNTERKRMAQVKQKPAIRENKRVVKTNGIATGVVLSKS
jgi:hypothetical protein